MSSATVPERLNGPFIPARFAEQIELHVAKNLLSGYDDAPLILGIAGRPGTGKTYQVDAVLMGMGVRPFRISGGQLESPQAGGPASLLRSQYLAAGGAMIRNPNIPAVMVINDIDAGIGVWNPQTQYTVNLQITSGQLMQLCDFPTDVEGRLTRRIPIIMTGNDLARLYPPLTRTGRMRIFNWEPTLSELTATAQGMFPGWSRDEVAATVRELARLCSKEPGPWRPEDPAPIDISTISDLKARADDRYLLDSMHRQGVRKFLASTVTNPMFGFDRQCEPADLIQEAKMLVMDRAVLDEDPLQPRRDGKNGLVNRVWRDPSRTAQSGNK